MEFEFLAGDLTHKISLEKKDDRYILRLGDKVWEADVRMISPNALSVLIEGRSHLVYIARDKDKKHISYNGVLFVLKKPGEEVRRSERGEDRALKGKSVVTAPMPGKVIKISVAENEAVRKNQTLAIVEAMKMENEIKSPLEGFVKKIFVAAGDLVDSEKPLLELEAKPAQG